jgi:CyaY protein
MALIISKYKLMLDDQQFRLVADEALESAYNALARASDEYGFECDFDGAVKVEFDDPPAKFVVSPNAPVKQIWVSAHSKSYKLDWVPARNAFVLADTGQTLNELMADAVGKQIGQQISLK